VSWWKGLVAKIIEAVAGWGQQELTRPSDPTPKPSEPPRKVIKYGKRVQ
jgi:hypothetical protein